MINGHPFGPGEKGVHFANNIDTYNLANYMFQSDSRLGTDNHGFPRSGDINSP